ncbi:hypothetical protein LOK49_LG09G02057 [Camellia lanceoleosa]|uniref:Uncharacterized protein n=1 Tax=Camellia lanceoleosa TaxID=1840588 RepID=A0ACC0GLW3_9ERIC|nr:hypothetical protein LOK49_LG09G02057 [Camellia lanceoleosa]
MPTPQLAADVSNVDCILNYDSESVSIGANNPEVYLHLPIVPELKIGQVFFVKKSPFYAEFCKDKPKKSEETSSLLL